MIIFTMINKQDNLLARYGKNHYSQNGEDGIISEILERLIEKENAENNQDVRWACDVGAWDGIHFSNTYNLISNQGFGGVSIECNKKKYAELKKNLEIFDNNYFINELAGFNQHDNLDALLSKTPIPKNFEVLSIDVDGVDYYLWQSLLHYKPKIVIIEYNPTIPNTVEYIQPKNLKIKHGSSAKALVNLGTNKDYVAVAATYCNLIFVDKKLSKMAGLPARQSIDELIPSSTNKSIYVFQGYEGEIIFSEPINKLTWHGTKIDLSVVKPLPRILQKYINDYTLIEQIIFGLYTNLKERGIMGMIKFPFKWINQILMEIVERLNPNQRRLLQHVKKFLKR